MGTFMEEITLENCTDRELANRGYISESQVRTLKVEAMPDTGAFTLVINEEVQEKLGLSIKGERYGTQVDGIRRKYPFTAPVKIQWKDHSTAMQAVVVAGAQKVLLGALPLEDMDLLVDPAHQTLVEAPEDQSMHCI